MIEKFKKQIFEIPTVLLNNRLFVWPNKKCWYVVEELPTQTAERKRPLGAGCMNKYVPFRQNHESTVVGPRWTWGHFPN